MSYSNYSKSTPDKVNNAYNFAELYSQEFEDFDFVHAKFENQQQSLR